MTEAEFDKICQAEYDNDPARVDKRFAMTINRVEHESGHFIDEKYPYFKLLSKIEYYSMVDKENARATKKKK